MRKYSRARRVAIAVACMVGSTSPSWSAGVCVARLKGAGDEAVERLSRIDQGRWIVETKNGLYQFAESSGGLSRYEGIIPSRISHIVPLGRDLSLILSSRGTSAGRVFRAQNDALKVQEVNGSE